MPTQDAQRTVIRLGFAVVESVVGSSVLDQLSRGIEQATLSKVGGNAQPRHALRNLFQAVPETTGLLHDPHIVELVSTVLGPKAFAVRGLFFDKVEGANWKVAWHQDQAIAIRSKHADDAVPGFGPASVKHGVPHTRASAEVLEQMLAVRIHLDDSNKDNGPLRCVPGSHILGRLDPQAATHTAKQMDEVTCTVKRGGVVLMRPLCLHASSPAKSPSHRRVIHIEFADCELPQPLAWHERVPLGVNAD